MIIVTGRVKARPEHFEAVRAASLAHVHRSRTEEGCISHGVAVDCEDPHALVFFERWRDQAALQKHFDQPASKAFVGALRDLVAEPPLLDIYPALDHS
jgi:quinol monooxygenase YgiN